MTPIRPQDLVRFKPAPEWSGMVLCIEADQALVQLAEQAVPWVSILCWFQVELLELLPEQFERLAA